MYEEVLFETTTIPAHLEEDREFWRVLQELGCWSPEDEADTYLKDFGPEDGRQCISSLNRDWTTKQRLLFAFDHISSTIRYGFEWVPGKSGEMVLKTHRRQIKPVESGRRSDTDRMVSE